VTRPVAIDRSREQNPQRPGCALCADAAGKGSSASLSELGIRPGAGSVGTGSGSRGRLVIRGARLVDPAVPLDRVTDLAIEDGLIVAVGDSLDAPLVIDGRGKVVLPGLFDAHVHLREPGQEEKESVESGSYAAAKGGFTAVACMPNTHPTIDTRAVLEFVLSRPRHVKVYPIGAITKGREGLELTEYGDLKEAGAVGLSDDGNGVQSANVMRRALEYSRPFDLPLIQHCQESSLSGDGLMHEGFVSSVLGLKGIPWTAEASMIARDLMLLEHVGGRLHVAHISCRQSIDLVRRAKERGLLITAEACPHHFVLTDQSVRGFDTCTKVNPPLREEADVHAIRAALVDGTIDLIASDHAPHTVEEKELDYAAAPFGISGLETSFALSYTHLVRPGTMTLGALVERMAHAPRRLFKIPLVTLETGSKADLTVVELENSFRIDRSTFKSRGKNTPFDGHEVYGVVHHTIVDGQQVYSI